MNLLILITLKNNKNLFLKTECSAEIYKFSNRFNNNNKNLNWKGWKKKRLKKRDQRRLKRIDWKEKEQKKIDKKGNEREIVKSGKGWIGQKERKQREKNKNKRELREKGRNN